MPAEFKKQYIERTTSSRVQMMLEGAIDTSVPGGVALAPYVSPPHFPQLDKPGMIARYPVTRRLSCL